MSKTERREISTTHDLWIQLLLYPTHTLPTAAAPVAIGLALALHDGILAPVPALIGFLVSWLIHIGGVFLDNYVLLTRHPENREHPELVEAVANGTLSLDTLRRAAIACFVVAALSGPYFWIVAGWPAAVLGLIGMVASFSYAAGPIAYARYGLADIIFFLMFGVVAVAGTYYVQLAAASPATGEWLAVLRQIPLEVYLVGLPTGALVTNVLLIDDIRDIAPDAAKGWRTGSVRFGRNFVRLEYIVLSVLAYLAPLALWLALGLSAWTLLPLVTLPFAIAIVVLICTHEQLAELVPATPRASMLSLTYSLLLAIGLSF